MHVVNLAVGLDPARFQTRLVTGRITEDEGDMTYYARERGVDILEIAGMSCLLSLWKDLRTLLTLFRIFRRERPSIVHTHMAKASTMGLLAALAAGMPVIVHTHRQAREMAEDLGVAPAERFAVIPLGLDLQPFADVDRREVRRRLRDQLNIEDDRPVIGIVGRMVPVKNHELLFDAVGILAKHMDPAPHVVVVGSGEREGVL